MDDQKSPAELTPKHVRAARALLAWSQQELAKAAGVATSTVADFERGHRTPVANNAQAIRAALEGAGIRFLPTGAVIGPSLTQTTPMSRAGPPIRWVDAQDLANWANRNDGAFSLPTLLSHLIRASCGAAAELRFPSDEGVRHPGWDGLTNVNVGTVYVPEGYAGWEITAQTSSLAKKATEDYQKRTKQPTPLDPWNATYIFVTLRHWPHKFEWVKARQAEGLWREVRAYDVDDLVHWIEQAPAIGLWLSTRLGKRPAETRELEELWQEWSLATEIPLTAELVLSDRDKDATEVLRWLRGAPSVLSLRATTTDEVAAFVHATISELPEDVAATYRSRCLVATTVASARALVSAPAPLYLILTEPDAGLAQMLVQRGHFVLQAYDEQPVSRGEVRTLTRPSREGIASALEAAGIAGPRAKALARDSARNLAVLRRLMPSAPGRLPSWAQESPSRALLAALLAGGWDENAKADQARLAELADEPYESVVRALASYVGEFDSPLQKIGSTWRIASPQDAWFLLAHHLSGADIARFEAAAYAVFSSADPRFEMDPGERWMASVKGIHREYSGLLRHGIGQVLITLALWGDRVRTVPNAARRVDAIVERLLLNADRQRWWSLSRDFRLLAEASPRAFLQAVEESLDQEDPPIRALFGAEDGGLLSVEHLSDLLWALETLAWSPELMPKATHVLARLDAIDTPPGRYANRPANSLREIHILWMPQTYANLDQRLRAIDLIRKKESDAAWKLMLGILPRGHDTSTPSPMPLWRDFSVDKVEVVTWALVSRGAAAISERLLADVKVNARRWSELLERFGDLAPGPDAGLKALEMAEPNIADKADRAVLWTSLRRVLHHHRRFPDVEWSMASEVLDRLEAIYDRFAPADPLERTAWLFEQSVGLPNPPKEGWEAEERAVDTERQRAAQAVFSEGGVKSILALARLVSTAGYIGKALVDAGTSQSDLDEILEASLRSPDSRERDVAHGLIVSTFRAGKELWAASLLNKAKVGAWGDEAIMTILRALPVQRWTWEQASQLGEETEEAYWQKAPVFWINEDGDAVSFAIRKFISVGRARQALALASQPGKKQLPTELLIELLDAAAHQPVEKNSDTNDATMFQHYVSEILQVLDERNDIDKGALVKLEWLYLPVLEHSRRPAKVLLRELAQSPPLFIQMLSAVFKPSEESVVIEPEPEDPENARAVASQAYRLLELWDHLPGTRDDGSIDGEVLEGWIKDARSLAMTVGRADIADSRIGHMLSASPIGTDGNWPAEAVRDAIDLFRSKPMVDGFRIGKANRRGITSRMPGDGGALERQEAAKYRKWAKAIAYDHPHTAKALDTLADNYEDDARREDEQAARLDWEK